MALNCTRARNNGTLLGKITLVFRLRSTTTWLFKGDGTFPFKTATHQYGELLSFPTCQFCQYVQSTDFFSLFIDFCTRKAVKRAAGLCAQHSVTILAMVRRNCRQNNKKDSCLKNGKERKPLHKQQLC